MPIAVINNPADYVRALLEIERTTSGPLLFAASFVSSIYFPEPAIRRFYGDHNADCAGAAGMLIDRQRCAVSRRHSLPRRELYEAQAFTSLLTLGIVHEQETRFRATPTEIKAVLRNIIEWSQAVGHCEIGITTEVLPLVFTLASPDTILIDIRTNYLYQRIQGIELRGEGAAFDAFRTEFDRLWASAITNRSTPSLQTLIETSLKQWEMGHDINIAMWPEMRHTERA